MFGWFKKALVPLWVGVGVERGLVGWKASVGVAWWDGRLRAGVALGGGVGGPRCWFV